MAAHVSNSPGRLAVSGKMILLRPDSNAVDPRFLAWSLATPRPQAFLDARKTGMAESQMNFANEDLLAMPIELPNMLEQHRISDFLAAETGRIDRLVDLRMRQSSRLEERYISAVSELTTPGISSSTDRDETWPWLPARLATARLGYMARVQSGVTVHGARERGASDAEFPYLRVANVQGEWVDLSEVKTITIPPDMARRSTLRPGDVVMTEANGNPDNLGRGAVWKGEIANMVHQNHVFAIRANQNRLLPTYFSALLAATHGRRYFRFTSNQVGIATTSSSKVLDFPVPQLSLEQQHRVVNEYERLRAAITRTRKALATQMHLFAERRQALITAAVTGQFDVSTASGRNVTDGV
ncbi:hypothetical protein [Streptomyces sp. NP-1717]|uniref:restriction endonuclease subunit S n=1 Tax=Streptomyces sp. NP-1717 TaxID=2704470 RepID=UPI001F5DD822|nr:hypothetical protein [Streptomyces sp. NP-1717]MCI3224392.1 hypothetical protein [Streptomyces sp. NP-1717]